MGIDFFIVQQSHDVQHLVNALLPLRPFELHGIQIEAQISLRCTPGKQVVALKNKSEVLQGVPRNLPSDVFAIQLHGASGRAVDTAQNLEERGFSTAGISQDHNKFFFINVHADVPNNLDVIAFLFASERFRNVFYAEYFVMHTVSFFR